MLNKITRGISYIITVPTVPIYLYSLNASFPITLDINQHCYSTIYNLKILTNLVVLIANPFGVTNHARLYT